MSDAAFSSDEPQDRTPNGQVPTPSDQASKALVLLPAAATRGDAPRWSQARFSDAPQAHASANRGRWRAAVSLAAVVLIGAAAAAQMHVVRAERGETQALDRRLDAIAAQLHALDANRPHDELAGLKKSLAEIKASAVSSHDVGGAVGQLTARVDRLEKDQSNHLDKLDKDSTQRLVDIAQRLEKLEAKATSAVVARAAPMAAAKTEVPKAAPVVSMETTGAIEKPKPRLRNFYLADIHNGYAMIGGPEGEFAVAPGDNVPGGGRVLRIERHGREWVVVTTLGQIASADE